MKHPARVMTYEELEYALMKAISAREVYEHVGTDGLRLYCYTEETVYERKWNPISLISRGLILDVERRQVVATPFPKFFNVGEAAPTIPDLKFETFDKIDGSLIIIFFHRGKWKCSTKGSLSSDQAKWATAWLHKNIAVDAMKSGSTFLAEAIYPENRIVVDYKDKQGLVLLGAFAEDGEEVTYEILQTTQYLGWEVVKRHSYNSISDLMEKAKNLDSNSEGWVIRFENGMRLKIKGDEYCRLHRLISGITPINVWKVMRGREQPEEYLVAENLEDMRRDLPEEFLKDFDTIVKILEEQLEKLLVCIVGEALKVSQLSDKEVGLQLHEFHPDVRRFIFPHRKGTLQDKKTRHALFAAIRPERNILEGYRSSTAINRIQNDI